MIALNELPMEQVEKLIIGTKELKEQFEEYINETEMDYIRDKILCVRGSLENYSIGTCQHNYIEVKDYKAFIDGVEKCSRNYGSSESLDSLVKQAQRLSHTNLFEHYAKKVKDKWMKEEILPTIEWIEKCGYTLYKGELSDDMKSLLECYVSNIPPLYFFDNDNNKLYKQIA